MLFTIDKVIQHLTRQLSAFASDTSLVEVFLAHREKIRCTDNASTAYIAYKDAAIHSLQESTLNGSADIFRLDFTPGVPSKERGQWSTPPTLTCSYFGNPISRSSPSDATMEVVDGAGEGGDHEL